MKNLTRQKKTINRVVSFNMLFLIIGMIALCSGAIAKNNDTILNRYQNLKTVDSENGKAELFPQLNYFSKEIINNSVRIEWRSEAESKGNYYILEKSYDKINYKPICIKKCEASLTETHSPYCFTDNDKECARTFYRLIYVYEINQKLNYLKLYDFCVSNTIDCPAQIVRKFPKAESISLYSSTALSR